MSTANSINENVLLQSEVVMGPCCIFIWIDKEENEHACVETHSDANSGDVYLWLAYVIFVFEGSPTLKYCNLLVCGVQMTNLNSACGVQGFLKMILCYDHEVQSTSSEGAI